MLFLCSLSGLQVYVRIRPWSVILYSVPKEKHSMLHTRILTEEEEEFTRQAQAQTSEFCKKQAHQIIKQEDVLQARPRVTHYVREGGEEEAGGQ